MILKCLRADLVDKFNTRVYGCKIRKKSMFISLYQTFLSTLYDEIAFTYESYCPFVSAR